MKNGTWKMENEKWKKELGSYGGNAVVKTILANKQTKNHKNSNLK